MTRQRKAVPKTDGRVPFTSPSEMSPRFKPDKPLIEITEEEKWRLIGQSGVLKNALVQESSVESTLEEELSLCDEIFNAIMLIIPFSFLLLLMEMCVSHSMSHLQHI